MSKHFIKALSAGVAIAFAAGGAWAQAANSGSTANTATTPESKVGVTNQDAKEATRKAVPRADTGTLVRTGPTATEQAANAPSNNSGNGNGNNNAASAPPTRFDSNSATPRANGVAERSAATAGTPADSMAAGNMNRSNMDRSNMDRSGNAGSNRMRQPRADRN